MLKHAMNTLPSQLSTRISLLALAVGLSAMAHAAPEGGVVRVGTGSIEHVDATTTINQASSRLAIDWNSFDVAAHESVNFVQPDSAAVALNRVLSNELTTIAGRINANGHVVLVNPNGVFFAGGSEVNVGGLVAAGLDMDPDAFATGELVLAGPVGGLGVVNEGLIRAAAGGNVALLGGRVVNEGVIDARLGQVTLATGSAMVMTFDERGLLGVRVTAGAASTETGALVNAGEITAAGGVVRLTAVESRDVFSSAVNTGDLGGELVAAVHDDGSFSLGAGGEIINNGSIDTGLHSGEETALTAGGSVYFSGRALQHNGTIRAAGHVEPIGQRTDLHASEVVLTATETLQLGDDASISVAGELPDGQSLAGGSIVLDGGAVHIGAVTLMATGAGGGMIHVGGAVTEQVHIASGAVMDVSGDASEYVGGDAGWINIHSGQVLNVEGQLLARGGFGGAAGGISLTGEAVRFRGVAHLGGGQLEYADTLPAGTLHIQGRDLILSNYDHQAVDSGVAVGSARVIGNVELVARHNLWVAQDAPVWLGRRESYSFHAQGQDGSIGYMDLHGLQLDAGDGLEPEVDSHYSFAAAGDLIAPTLASSEDAYAIPRAIHFDFSSRDGYIAHLGDVHTYGGDYRATAARSIEFADGAALYLAPSSDDYNGRANLHAGTVIDLRLMAGALVSSGSGPTLVASAGEINLEAPDGLPSAAISANRLTLSGGGKLHADIDVTVSTQINTTAGAGWRLSGGVGRLSGQLQQGTRLTVSSTGDLMLGGLTASAANVTLDAVGDGATLRQAGGTRVRASQTQLLLRADNIELGAGGASSVELADGSSRLLGYFSDSLTLSGAIDTASERDYYLFTGDRSANVVNIEATARLSPVSGALGGIRLLGGDDQVNIAAAGLYRLRLGTGADTVTVSSPGVELNWLDFSDSEDQLVTNMP